LRTVVERYEHHAYAWGVHDCAQFVAAYFAELNGYHPIPVEIEYADERAALRLMLTGGGLRALVVRSIGEPRSGEPEVGDIVLSQLSGNGGDVRGLGIYNAHFVLGVLPDINGVCRYSAEHITDAWSPWAR
jgi:hypothetical protein